MGNFSINGPENLVIGDYLLAGGSGEGDISMEWSCEGEKLVSLVL